MQIKIQDYNRALGTINQIFKSTTIQKHTRTKAYKILTRPILKQKEQRFASAEINFFFFRKTADSGLLDHKWNDELTEELKRTPTAEYPQQHRRNWLQRINRTTRSRPQKQTILYVPRGRRSRGRPPNRWRETVTGHSACYWKGTSCTFWDAYLRNAHMHIRRAVTEWKMSCNFCCIPVCYLKKHIHTGIYIYIYAHTFAYVQIYIYI